MLNVIHTESINELSLVSTVQGSKTKPGSLKTGVKEMRIHLKAIKCMRRAMTRAITLEINFIIFTAVISLRTVLRSFLWDYNE